MREVGPLEHFRPNAVIGVVLRECLVLNVGTAAPVDCPSTSPTLSLTSRERGGPQSTSMNTETPSILIGKVRRSTQTGAPFA